MVEKEYKLTKEELESLEKLTTQRKACHDMMDELQNLYVRLRDEERKWWEDFRLARDLTEEEINCMKADTTDGYVRKITIPEIMPLHSQIIF